ncbi:MAG: hypothetical protein QW292_04890 [Candidatus Parvarchaeota archaeon]
MISLQNGAIQRRTKTFNIPKFSHSISNVDPLHGFQFLFANLTILIILKAMSSDRDDHEEKPEWYVLFEVQTFVMTTEI